MLVRFLLGTDEIYKGTEVASDKRYCRIKIEDTDIEIVVDTQNLQKQIFIDNKWENA